MRLLLKLRRRNTKGQSLVELAVSLMILMLILAGAVDFGVALFSYVAIRDAAQEGAMFASFNPTDTSGIRARVRDSSSAPVDFSDTSVVPDDYIDISIIGDSCEGTSFASGQPKQNQVEVAVEYDHAISMPLLGRVLGSQNIHLRATVTDTILMPRCAGP